MHAKGGAVGQGGPCARERVQPAHEVVHLLGRLSPVDPPVFFEKLGRFLERLMFCQLGFLRHSLRVSRGQGVDAFHKKVLARFQNAVVHVPCGVVGSDGDLHTTEHMARVDLVLEQKRGGPRHRFAIQDCPVNGCRTAVLRQQGSVKVDGAQAGEIPNHFWQHSEGDHHPQVRRPRFKGGPEFGRLQLLRLGQGEVMLFRHHLDLGSAQGATSAGRSVGCRHDTNNLVV